jgi:reversibly glycosylated polypeptide/UDP-arabinopyranose mutase
LFYFPLMGEGQPYRRFDDIWAGVIAKKVMDHLGWPMSVGEPAVFHVRASDPVQNRIKEMPGITRNETFWQEIDGIELTAGDPAGCMRELGEQLGRSGSDDYMRRLGMALQVWASLFEATVPATTAPEPFNLGGRL